MAKTFLIHGEASLNVAEPEVSGGIETGYISVDENDYTGYDSSSYPFTIVDIFDQKPVVSVLGFHHTFDDINDATASWDYFSQSLQTDESLKTKFWSSSLVPESLQGEVVRFRIEDSEHQWYDAVSGSVDAGHYIRYRDFYDEVLVESYLIPTTKSIAGYNIPEWE
mgnify:FL=1